jgi:hypothetical protein
MVKSNVQEVGVLFPALLLRPFIMHAPLIWIKSMKGTIEESNLPLLHVL